MVPTCYIGDKMGDFNGIKTWRSFMVDWVRFDVEKIIVFWTCAVTSARTSMFSARTMPDIEGFLPRWFNLGEDTYVLGENTCQDGDKLSRWYNLGEDTYVLGEIECQKVLKCV